MALRKLFSGLVTAAAWGAMLQGSAMASAPLPPDQAQYAPYTSLIGVWDMIPESGGEPVGRLTFRWGPNKAYIWCAQSLLVKGKEYPHFEGMMGWNGISKKLDMLLSLDLMYGRTLEEGTFSVQPDGSFVREITSTYGEGTVPIGGNVVGPEGQSAHFRQTFTVVDANTMLTSVMRETEKGWVPTFPGSDHLKMTRHTNG